MGKFMLIFQMDNEMDAHCSGDELTETEHGHSKSSI